MICIDCWGAIMRRLIGLIVALVAIAAIGCGSDGKPIDTASFLPFPPGFEIVGGPPTTTSGGGAGLSGSAVYYVIRAPDGTTLDDASQQLRSHLLSRGFREGKKSHLRQADSRAVATIYTAADYRASPPTGAETLDKITTATIDDQRDIVLTVTKFRIG